MERDSYSTDLTDKQWETISPRQAVTESNFLQKTKI